MDFGSNPTMFLFLVFLGLAGAYFVGIAMDGVLGADGFGVLMNATIMVAGGFLGLRLSNSFHLPLGEATSRAVLIVCGAFLSLALLAVLKAIGRRLGF